jgi:hypothetical protein
VVFQQHLRKIAVHLERFVLSNWVATHPVQVCTIRRICQWDATFSRSEYWPWACTDFLYSVRYGFYDPPLSQMVSRLGFKSNNRITRNSLKVVTWQIKATFLLSHKLHGLSPQATAACRRSYCQLFADRGCHVVSVTDPYGRILGFLDRSRYFSIK